MDELLILVPVRIHFPLQSIGLKTLDHFMGNHFFYNYVTFDFLLPLKLPVGHVAERRFKRLNEPHKQTIYHPCSGEALISLHTYLHLLIFVHAPTYIKQGRERKYMGE